MSRLMIASVMALSCVGCPSPRIDHPIVGEWILSTDKGDVPHTFYSSGKYSTLAADAVTLVWGEFSVDDAGVVHTHYYASGNVAEGLVTITLQMDIEVNGDTLTGTSSGRVCTNGVCEDKDGDFTGYRIGTKSLPSVETLSPMLNL
ncbi:MAG: hypothetical protein IT364_20005 [Candidatus Hydrogenedentes bacterium]|nr:hypothetical protein [Candidatus Hydrogenedentota bacterium]